MHVNKKESVFRYPLTGVKLSPAEYDLYMNCLYQYGSGTWNKLSMRLYLLAACTESARGLSDNVGVLGKESARLADKVTGVCESYQSTRVAH